MNIKPLSDERVAELLSSLAGEDYFVFLDSSMPDGENHRSLLFVDAEQRLVCRSTADRSAFLDRLETFLDQGCYLAGWFAYEFFHEGRGVVHQVNDAVLAEFGVFRQPCIHDHLTNQSSFPAGNGCGTKTLPYRLDQPLPNMSRDHYCRAITRILGYIAAGDTYQVNYTCKMRFGFDGSPIGLYRDLRRSQPVPYGCFIKSGDRCVMSCSPELFFRAQPGRIIARPMKGTSSRGRTAGEDLLRIEQLRGDEKNRSENVMIVDLLRNDLTRLAETVGGGQVSVVSLFDVERYRTVLQMTSTIIAEGFGRHRFSPADLVRALFPCGSVTGAPKIRTMEIIDELELEPRDIYTGAIGYFAPDREAVFNVPIRTVVLDGQCGEMGIGSGIVADSTPEDEWQECLLKARFLTCPAQRMDLLETLLFQPGEGYLFLAEHMDRLAESALYFTYCFDREQTLQQLTSFAAGLRCESCHRIRLTLARNGALQITATPCDAPLSLVLPPPDKSDAASPVLIDFADEPIESSEILLYHKTTSRSRYDQAYRSAREAGLFDVLFCNERGEMTEGSISTIFIQHDGRFYTPPLYCGLLPGIMRSKLLANKLASEMVLTRDDLRRAERLYVCNSVRGVRLARLKS